LTVAVTECSYRLTVAVTECSYRLTVAVTERSYRLTVAVTECSYRLTVAVTECSYRLTVTVTECNYRLTVAVTECSYRLTVAVTQIVTYSTTEIGTVKKLGGIKCKSISTVRDGIYGGVVVWFLPLSYAIFKVSDSMHAPPFSFNFKDKQVTLCATVRLCISCQ